MNAMREPVDVSVVVPSYNEMANIRRGVLDDMLEYLKKQSYSWELVLTDDGSTDDTLESLVAFTKKHDHVVLIENPHRGKGPTVFEGMTKAVGSVRVFTDFDQATPLSEIDKLLPFVDHGYDVVIGSREVQGAKREREPFYRHVMGKGFNTLVQLLAVRGIHDTQCGFKLFTKKAVETLFPKLWIYRPTKVRYDAFTGAFDVELLFLARKFGFRIAEVPVSWKYVRTVRVSALKDSARMFFDLLKIRVVDVLGKYQAK
ncbi:MAG TPA: glycosyltransferase [Patescibacteria group bacterium]|nr:glycosyltransferase [Patescibacteria group bacterium]